MRSACKCEFTESGNVTYSPRFNPSCKIRGLFVDGGEKPLIRPPRIAAIYFLAALGFNALVPTPRIIQAPYQWIGLALLGVGLGIMLWAFQLFRQRGTTIFPSGAPTALVTSGPFRISRNPMYLAVVVMLLGGASLIGTLPMLLVPLAFFLTMQALYIPHEEKALAHFIGEEYLDYQARVRRWL